MGKKTLSFEEIQIYKMPGLRNGLNAYENLSPQINIIAGPNASGKSSTARAIQHLLWQYGTEQISAKGRFSIEDESWFSEVDASTLRFQKEGSPAELTGIPSGDDQSRYMLSLHELIRKDDKNLAESILKDAIGGYDIDGAKEKLGYSDTKKSINTNQSREYRTASKDLNKIEEQQKKLQGDEEKLKKLHEDKQLATEAQKQFSFYELVKDFKEKQACLTGIRDKLSEFPDSMQRVNGDDYTNFDELIKEIQNCEGTLADLESDIRSRKEVKAALKLPENGINQLDLRTAAGYVEEIEKLENEITKANQEIERAKSDLKHASERLGLNENEVEFEGLDAGSIDKTESFWQQAFDQSGTVRQLNKEVQKLNEEQQETPGSGKLNSGITHLSNWLSTYGSPSKPISSLYLILIIAIAIGSVTATLYFGPIGYAGIALIPVLFYLNHRQQKKSLNTQLSTREDDFKKTGLKAPATWDADNVASRVNDLLEELNNAIDQESLRKRLNQREDELHEATSSLNNSKAQAVELKKQIGVIPGLDEEHLKNYSSLYWHLKHAIDWDRARDRIKAEEQALKKANETIAQWLDKLNVIFKTYGLERVNSYADAKAGRDHLQDLREQFNELSRTIETTETNLQRTLENKNRAKESLQNICDRLKVTPDDAFKVKNLVGHLEGFTKLEKDENQAAVLLDDAQSKLETSGLYESEKDKISDYTIEQIVSEMEQFKQKASKCNELQKQITEIETRVHDTKQNQEIEEALQDKEVALMRLEELYKENAGSIIGDLLVKHLKSDLDKKNMPEVFERASKLFKRITQNRYELLVDSVGDKAEFRAKDLYDGVGRSLDELSTGTRIQLIMSVRLAFIEKAESDIKLPLLADELLANSDSKRAGAIIEALIEISKEGRQIFYFTAQEDEVSKWKYKLNESQVKDFEIYVIEKSEKKLPQAGEYFKGIQLHKEIPSPDTMDYDEYGTALGVPALNNIFIPVEQLHIWYFLDKPELLYNVMKSGIENWRMLKNYLKDDGIIEGLEEETRVKIEDRANLIDRYLELLRYGRNQPINRDILVKSGAISDSFIDEVSKKLKESDYSPNKLLKALEDGEVARFRNDKREELKDYLINNGYIQQIDPYSEEEIQIKMKAFVSQMDIKIEDAQLLMDRIKM